MLWFGRYSDRSNHLWASEKTTTQATGDTGLNIGWNNRLIPPDQTRTFSFLMGVGKNAAPPELVGEIGAVINPQTVDVSAQVKDVSGAKDTLYYVFDMDTPTESEPGRVQTVTATGSALPMGGSIPRPAGWQAGEVHTVSLWVMNESNAMSTIKTVAILVTEGDRGDEMKPATPATLTYNANGGGGSAPATVNSYELQTIELATNTFTAPTGKKFGGWLAPDGSVYPEGSNYRIPQDVGGGVVMKAYWINSNESLYYIDVYEQQLDGTYKLVENTLNNANVGTSVSATPETRTGFAFNAGKSLLSGTVANAATPLHLKVYYDRTKVNITMNSGITSVPTKTVQKLYGAQIEAADIPDCVDPAGPATFKGWFDRTNGMGNQIQPGRRMSTDITLCAYWQPKNTTATFDYNYVQAANRTQTVPLSTVAETSFPYNIGLKVLDGSFPVTPKPYVGNDGKTYRFEGWYLDGAGTPVTATTAIKLASSIVVKGKWAECKTVTLRSSGEGTIALTGGSYVRQDTNMIVSALKSGEIANATWSAKPGYKVTAVVVDGVWRDDLVEASSFAAAVTSADRDVLVVFSEDVPDPVDPDNPDNPDPDNPDPEPDPDPDNPQPQVTYYTVSTRTQGGDVGLTDSFTVRAGGNATVSWRAADVASLTIDGILMSPKRWRRAPSPSRRCRRDTASWR